MGREGEEREWGEGRDGEGRREEGKGGYESTPPTQRQCMEWLGILVVSTDGKRGG